ncbi:MAG: hypothetical protein PF637_00580 [Spirochaetes bacterium]|nr:hypothetical protein [Spirochaetota bacterium]
MGRYYGFAVTRFIKFSYREFSKRIRVQIIIIVLGIPTLVIALFTPLFYHFFSFNDLALVFEPRTLRILVNTTIQAALSSLIALILSIGPVIYLCTKKSLLNTIIESTYFIPFFFPVISTVIAFSSIMKYLPVQFHYSLPTVLAAHAFYNTPIYVMFLSSAIRNIPINRIESASLETNSGISLTKHIILPSVMNALLRSFFLVFLFCFTSFGIILALGNVSLTNFEIAIFTSLNTSLNIPAGLAYALIQLVILLGMNLLISKSSTQKLEIQTYKKRKGFIASLIFSLLFIAMEFSVILISVFHSIIFSISKRTNYFINLFSDSFNERFPLIEALRNTSLLAVLTSVTITIITYLILRKNSRILDIIITSLFGFSSAILSIALLTFYIYYHIPSFIVLLFGYAFISLPISYSFMQAHVQGFNATLRETAISDGATILQTIRYVEIPLLMPVLFRNFIQIFAIIFGEFTISYIFQSGGDFPLLSVVHYGVSAQRLLGEAYAINSITILFITALFAICSLMGIQTSELPKNSKR